jgi:hypothetical protein
MVLYHGTGRREEDTGVTVPPADNIRRSPLGALDLDDLAVMFLALMEAADRQLISRLSLHVRTPFLAAPPHAIRVRQ